MGKSAKKRFCPAVQREISSAECGENRISRYACPAECPFNPYAPANYEMVLALDDALNDKASRYFIENDPDPAALARQATRLLQHPSPQALNAFLTWRQYLARDAGGRTMAERWEQAGFPSLKNDERVLMKARMKTRMALIEVRRVIDHEQVEVVDLLDDEHTPMVIRDRSFAGGAVRFGAILALSFPLPHYWRLVGAAAVIPDIALLEPEEVVREIVQHLGGPLGEHGLRLWVTEHFERLNEALAATNLARNAQTLASIDARCGRVVYELRRPFAECRSRLDEHSDIEPDDLTEAEDGEGFSGARVWFERDEPSGPATQGKVVLGRILLAQAHWRIEAMGEARTARLRGEFESLMGSKVRFTGERLDDYAADLKPKRDYDQSLVPPRLLEDPQTIVISSSRVPAPLDPRKSKEDYRAELLTAEHRRFLDLPNLALDQQTPREAARDPKQRPKLIRLIKQRVHNHDEHNLKTGRRDDINWLVRELALTELLFDPPPLRPPIGPDEDETALDEPAEFERAPSSLPLRRGSTEPLSMEEVFERIKKVFERFETASEALQALQALPAEGGEFINIAAELALEWVGREELDFLLSFLIQAPVRPGAAGLPGTGTGLRSSLPRL
jgi:hypothetical protein